MNTAQRRRKNTAPRIAIALSGPLMAIAILGAGLLLAETISALFDPRVGLLKRGRLNAAPTAKPDSAASGTALALSTPEPPDSRS